MSAKSRTKRGRKWDLTGLRQGPRVLSERRWPPMFARLKSFYCFKILVWMCQSRTSHPNRSVHNKWATYINICSTRICWKGFKIYAN